MNDDATPAGFIRSSFEHDGDERVVYSAGTGPAVIVIHEMPGLHPGVIDFARRVVDRGFHVRMPSLFGTPGKPVGGRTRSGRSSAGASPGSSRPGR